MKKWKKWQKKWKMYVYAQCRCIKKMYIPEDENPFEKEYVINVYGKKYILGSNCVKIIVKPYKLKYTNEIKKEIHVEAQLYTGVDYESEVNN